MRLVESSRELENEIKMTRFMEYPVFCESKLLIPKNEENFCYKCQKFLEPLTYCEPDFYYQPCWDCSNKRKSDRELITEGILRNIKDYYTKITGDRYYQLFIVDDIYYNTTFPHTYSVFKKVVNSLNPPSRNDIWFLDWKLGFPKIISPENIDGIKIVNLTDIYSPIKLEKDIIEVGEFKIYMPELTTFDTRHHSRYSILNKSGDRKSKKIKIDNRCFRFYNTPNDNTKAIFRVTKNDEDISLWDLRYQDFVIIKLAIMRNKNFLKLIFDIVLEISKSMGILKDTIFLKNTVILEPRNSENQLNLVWTSLSDYREDNAINISII